MSTPNITLHTSALDSILSASPVVQLVLLILVGMSILSWAIGFMKWQQFKLLKKSNEPFSNRFWKTNSLDSLYEDVDQFPNSSLARLFKAAYGELQKLAQKPDTNSSALLSGSDNLERVLQKEIDFEISQMESKLNLLATTGSTGPFIGLFGTVWGIMGAFQKIGATGSASLAVVAPGISEALIATAIGLAAAIPAVIMYNHFLTEIRKQEMQLNSFMSDFLNIAKRNFFKE